MILKLGHKTTRIFLVLLAIGTIAAGCNTASNNTGSNSNQSSNTGTPAPTNAPVAIAPNQQNVVMYTDSGFSPKTLTIKQGDTVAFENTASDDMRVASNPHPAHTGYPTTGGCVASTFDSCTNIAPGQMWLFKFDIVGNWGYHNHLNPSEGGTITVQSATSSSAPAAATTPKVSAKTPAKTTPKVTPTPTYVAPSYTAPTY